MEDDMEEMLQRHKKEKKDLQGKIQNMKHTTPKGDKKKKKEITAEIARLELELNSKHEKELKESKSSTNDNLVQSDELSENETQPTVKESQKLTKNQRRKDKKALQEKERDQRIADAEVENLKGVRHVEGQKIKSQLKLRRLAIFEVPSDGNCMYKALEHQLSLKNISTSTEKLRSQTAGFMREHSDDFMPFLTHPSTGDPLSKEEFEEFCKKTESSTYWGGQIELRALSHTLKSPIEVVQAEGPAVIIGEEYIDHDKLILSYHRHAFRSGEHYNSVIPLPEQEEEEEELDGH